MTDIKVPFNEAPCTMVYQVLCRSFHCQCRNL